jgi:ketosteroid isomerase-like protein
MNRRFAVASSPFKTLALFLALGLHAAPQKQDDLLQTRASVWRAWFAGDIPALEKLVPPDTIVVGSGDQDFETQADIIADSKKFHDNGGKLIRLEFPVTKVQRFGDVAILYSRYVYEIESGSERTVHAGYSTETFVFRDGHWVNPGWQTAADR